MASPSTPKKSTPGKASLGGTTGKRAKADSDDEPLVKQPKVSVGSLVAKPPKPIKVSERQKELVTSVLVRWWYALPDWPPPLDWKALLKARGYREVSIPAWEDEDDVEDGLRKCHAIGSFPGLFRNAEGKVVDCRPMDSCPCFNTMATKSRKELLELLVKALKGQMDALPKTVHEEKLRKDLKQKLDHAEKARPSASRERSA